MMRKLFRLLRGLAILVGWTFVFIYLTDLLFIVIWNFDFMSSSSWRVMGQYWDNGGIIKSASDVLLFVGLFALPVLWFIGLRYAFKAKYLQLMLSPVKFIYNLFNRSSGSTDSISIRYTKSNEQKVEEIREQLESLKPKKAQSSQGIRSDIKRKISNDL